MLFFWRTDHLLVKELRERPFFHRCFIPSTPVGINEQGVTQNYAENMRLGHTSSGWAKIILHTPQMGVHAALESWQIIPIWKTIGWKTVPLIYSANKEPRWPGNSPALRNLDTERVQRIDTASGARSNKCWKHRCMAAIGTSAKVIGYRPISEEQTQESNILSVGQVHECRTKLS